MITPSSTAIDWGWPMDYSCITDWPCYTLSTQLPSIEIYPVWIWGQLDSADLELFVDLLHDIQSANTAHIPNPSQGLVGDQILTNEGITISFENIGKPIWGIPCLRSYEKCAYSAHIEGVIRVWCRPISNMPLLFDFCVKLHSDSIIGKTKY